jgi:hypothetical protein
MTVDRNDPCPCGSGKKYKKCCLAKDEATASDLRGEKSAIQTSMDWLYERYPEQVGTAIHDDFMGERDEDELEALESLPPHLAQSLMINIGEWLLTEAVLTVGGKERRALDLVLGPKGPRLTAAGREWLIEVARRPLSLYEVREVKKGEGLLLKDLLQPEAAPVWVHEKTASGLLVPWEIFGARLACKEGGMVMTGAAYPMDRERAHTCLESIEDEISEAAADSAPERRLIAWNIIDYWLESLLEERPLPRLVDAATGEKLDLTTDRYRVLDWKTLGEALASQADVEGNQREGWTRFLDLEDGRRRLLASLTAGKGDLLEVFCRSLKQADTTREWLEGLAGGAVAYKIREVVDPRSQKARDATAPVAPAELPREVERQLMFDYFKKHYESWPTIPLPALGGKSPLQAVKTRKGRAEVVELLKSFELLEHRRASQTGGEPFDLRFLWERLGIDRESC